MGNSSLRKWDPEEEKFHDYSDRNGPAESSMPPHSMETLLTAFKDSFKHLKFRSDDRNFQTYLEGEEDENGYRSCPADDEKIKKLFEEVAKFVITSVQTKKFF